MTVRDLLSATIRLQYAHQVVPCSLCSTVGTLLDNTLAYLASSTVPSKPDSAESSEPTSILRRVSKESIHTFVTRIKTFAASCWTTCDQVWVEISNCVRSVPPRQRIWSHG